MYQLKVFHPGAQVATETVSLKEAAQVLDTIPVLLAKHADCHRVEVVVQGTKLFAVDCSGARLD